MLEILLYAGRAIMPLLLTMALGCWLRHSAHWSDDFYRQLNSFCFHVLLPVQLFLNVYAIEEYKEGAVCLTHDKEHYFVYICKDNDADDVEYFPIHDEKAVAMAFATRIRNKMNDKKPA